MYRRDVAPGPTPLEFLQLVADPQRWRLLAELGRSDRRVGELAELVGQAPNLVSYHLGELRTAGLVSSRRSSADGRDTYYRFDLARCRDLLDAAGIALHPALARPHATSGRPPRAPHPQAARPLPLHREQRPLADGRGAARRAQ